MYHPSHLPGAVPRAIELCTFGAQDRNIFPIIIPYIHWPYLFNSGKATINFNLPPVRQCGRKGVCKCDSLTCLTNGGQQGVIAQDRRLRRAGAKEGAPSSKNSLSLFITCIGEAPIQKLYILFINFKVSLVLMSSSSHRPSELRTRRPWICPPLFCGWTARL